MLEMLCCGFAVPQYGMKTTNPNLQGYNVFEQAPQRKIKYDPTRLQHASGGDLTPSLCNFPLLQPSELLHILLKTHFEIDQFKRCYAEPPCSNHLASMLSTPRPNYFQLRSSTMSLSSVHNFYITANRRLYLYAETLCCAHAELC